MAYWGLTHVPCPTQHTLHTTPTPWNCKHLIHVPRFLPSLHWSWHICFIMTQKTSTQTTPVPWNCINTLFMHLIFFPLYNKVDISVLSCHPEHQHLQLLFHEIINTLFIHSDFFPLCIKVEVSVSKVPGNISLSLDSLVQVSLLICLVQVSYCWYVLWVLMSIYYPWLRASTFMSCPTRHMLHTTPTPWNCKHLSHAPRFLPSLHLSWHICFIMSSKTT